MYSTKFRAVSQDYRLALFFQHGIDHIGTHHIATGKPSFRLPAINTNKCFAEMHLLDALACQRANHTFAFFLVHATEQNDFTRRVFQQMRDVAADRDDSGIFLLLAQSPGEQGIAATIFDKDGFARLNQ